MLEANNHLNQQQLESFSDDALESYTLYVEQQMANLAIYYSQIRYEWQRRYPDE